VPTVGGGGGVGANQRQKEVLLCLWVQTVDKLQNLSMVGPTTTQ